MHYVKLCNGKPFRIGDMVWVHCPAVNPLCSIVIAKGHTSYIRCLMSQIQHRDNNHKSMVVHFNRIKPCIQLPSSLIMNQTDDLHVAGPGEDQRVVEYSDSIDGEVPAEASESDNEIETEELPVEQGDQLQGDEEIQDAQIPEDVPATLRS